MYGIDTAERQVALMECMGVWRSMALDGLVDYLNDDRYTSNNPFDYGDVDEKKMFVAPDYSAANWRNSWPKYPGKASSYPCSRASA